MKSGSVRIPTEQGGFRWGKWAAVYNATGEIPLFTVAYPEGEARWYGSGMCEVILSALPITLRMPAGAVGGAIRWTLPAGIRREATMALRKIVTESAAPGATGPGATDAAQWPNLLEHLTLDKYPDGSARKLSCVVLVAGPAGWQGCLSDKDNDRVMWKTAATLEGLLLTLEEGAALDDPSSWRQAAGSKFKGKKRS